MVTQALYVTGASHYCILVKIVWERLKLDVSNSPVVLNVEIKLGDKSVISSKSCVVVELLVKLNKLFVDLNSCFCKS